MRFTELRGAITRDGPSPGARAVWWAIAAHANGDGDAWPSTDLIACMAGMSVRSVTANLRELEQFGLLETTRVQHRRNRYHVVTSAEPQFRFPTGTTLPVNRKQASGSTGNAQRSDQQKQPLEVHREDVLKGAGTSSDAHDGSGATPLRGSGAVCTSCRKPIVFATLRSGRKVALDPEPDPSGTYVLLGDDRVFELGAYQGVADEVRARLRRRHNDVCEQVSALGDLLGATRVNTWREEARARKLHGEAGR